MAHVEQAVTLEKLAVFERRHDEEHAASLAAIREREKRADARVKQRLAERKATREAREKAGAAAAAAKSGATAAKPKSLTAVMPVAE